MAHAGPPLTNPTNQRDNEQSMTNEQRKALANMANEYEQDGHPDIADTMRRNAREDAEFNSETVLSEIITAEVSYIW